MSCNYESRCLNSDKCYRCYGEKLLKLPEDKSRNINRINNKANANAKDSWKDLEQSVANKLNNVPTFKKAERTLRSGALPYDTGDVRDSILHIECKEREGTELKTGDKSISLRKNYLTKAKKECEGTPKKMCLPFRFKGDSDIYAIMDFDDLCDLVTNMKAYMDENARLNKEIEILKNNK